MATQGDIYKLIDEIKRSIERAPGVLGVTFGLQKDMVVMNLEKLRVMTSVVCSSERVPNASVEKATKMGTVSVSDKDGQRLLEAARGVRANAYAPYSVYQVGAAVLGADGEIYTGCNVENVSFGLTLCAERAAVAAMVAAGCRELHGVAVATSDGGTPCGMCRQVLAEFAAGADVKIWCSDEEGNVREHSVDELLPDRFRTEIIKE